MNENDLLYRPGLLADQRILVTGGGTGLGLVMAEAFLLLGADVVICGRRRAVLEDAADDLRHRHGGAITAVACDIRSPEEIDAMLDTIWADGPLSALVNNAAGNFLSRTEDLTPGGFDAISRIVLRGGFLVTAACGRRWLRDGLAASVVSILASWIDGAAPYTVPSAMSKAGIEMMTRSLAVEWAPRGIRLNAIAPGAFPTEGVQAHLRSGEPALEEGGANSGNPMGRNGRMTELANLAAFLVSPGVDYLTGQTIAIDGGDHLVRMPGLSERASWSDEQWRAERESVRAYDRTHRTHRDQP